MERNGSAHIVYQHLVYQHLFWIFLLEPATGIKPVTCGL